MWCLISLCCVACACALILFCLLCDLQTVKNAALECIGLYCDRLSLHPPASLSLSASSSTALSELLTILCKSMDSVGTRVEAVRVCFAFVQCAHVPYCVCVLHVCVLMLCLRSNCLVCDSLSFRPLLVCSCLVLSPSPLSNLSPSSSLLSSLLSPPTSDKQTHAYRDAHLPRCILLLHTLTLACPLRLRRLWMMWSLHLRVCLRVLLLSLSTLFISFLFFSFVVLNQVFYLCTRVFCLCCLWFV